MKTVHLLCNAHLDPEWLWQWKEGAAEAVSTFRVAADFCEQYDGFVFNHNESLLYEWVEEFEPELFERIRKLVKAGKWKILGGWYLQPDCLMPSGESILSQIALGRSYFMEKFGVVPTVAMNVDPFGHSRGMVQIMQKTGYTGYLFMRPNQPGTPFADVHDFLWKGFADSEIIGHRLIGGYAAVKGNSLPKLKRTIEVSGDQENVLCLWGVGNHGGGPSKGDLEEINEFAAASEHNIIHSDAESYFAGIDTSSLPVIDRSITHCMPGCYTSMVRIKQANRRLENKIALTKKMMSCAAVKGMTFEEDKLAQIEKDLAFCQFHDVLPGTGIASVEEDSLRRLSSAEDMADRLTLKAFLALCKDEKKAKDGEIPVMVFNPHPYPVKGVFEVEFLLENQNWNEGEKTIAHVYDREGNLLPSQNEQAASCIPLDWIEHIAFAAELAPSSITRFDCKTEVLKDYRMPPCDEDSECFRVTTDELTVEISKKTGLIKRFVANGICLAENTGVLDVMQDNGDPWGMTVDSFLEKKGTFTLLSDEDANAFSGNPDTDLPNVRVIENGDVRTKIQATFGSGRSYAVVEYTIPKVGIFMDIDIRLFSNDANQMIKYRVDTTLENPSFRKQTMFGAETPDMQIEENFQKWCGAADGDKALYVINEGIYGGHFEGSSISLSLLRTPFYAGHPLTDRSFPKDRFLPRIDMGERTFRIRLTAEADVEREAMIFNEKPMLLSFFPNGEGEESKPLYTIDDPSVQITSIRKQGDGFFLHLFNSSDKACTATLQVAGAQTSLTLKPYELKFLRTDNGTISETEFLPR